MRIVRSLTLLLATLMLVSACGQPAAQPRGGGQDAVPKPTDKRLAFLTGGTAGTYYPFGGAMATIWGRSDIGVTVTVEATGASVENVRQLSQRRADIALVQNDIADYAANGTEMFQGNRQRVLGIAIMYPELIQLVARADAGVNSVTDLRGKRVGLGAPGSGNEANARQILEIAGLKREDIQGSSLSFAEMAAAMKDRRLDAMFVTAGVPNSAIQDIASSQAIRIVPISGDFARRVKDRYKFFADATIPGGVYTGVAGETQTIAVQATLVAREDLEENVVYWLTRTLFEKQAELGQAHAKGRELVRDKALAGMSIDIHPGAKRYYDEVGVKKP